MNTKTVLISAMLVLAVLLSACGGTTVVGPNGQPLIRSLTVTGMGEVTLSPDIAYVNIGVRTEDATASAAMTKNSTETQAVVKALTDAGVAAEDLQTSNFNIYANNQLDLEGKPTGITYIVENTVYVKVRDLAKLGDLLDSVVQAGANNVNSIQFDVVDKTKAMTDARAAAVKSAQAQAQELASTTGVSLGSIQTISYYDSVPMPFAESKGMGGAFDAAALAAPISPGTLKISASVTLTYEIK